MNFLNLKIIFFLTLFSSNAFATNCLNSLKLNTDRLFIKNNFGKELLVEMDKDAVLDNLQYLTLDPYVEISYHEGKKNQLVFGFDEGNSFLSKAVHEKRFKVVQEILKHPYIDVNTTIYKGIPPLTLVIWAAPSATLEMVRIKRNYDLYQKLYLDRLRIGAILLKHPDIDVNLKTKPDGYTPLHIAVGTSRYIFVRELLNNPDLDVNAKDINGRTALMWTTSPEFVYNIKITLKILNMLLDHPQIDLNIKDRGGRTALMWALMSRDLSTVPTEVIRLLIMDKRIDLNLKNRSGKTVLMIAESKKLHKISEMIKFKLNER